MSANLPTNVGFEMENKITLALKKKKKNSILIWQAFLAELENLDLFQ